jgi:hypothetical protein
MFDPRHDSKMEIKNQQVILTNRKENTVGEVEDDKCKGPLRVPRSSRAIHEITP